MIQYHLMIPYCFRASVMYSIVLPPYITKFSHNHRNEEFNGSTFVCAERVLYIIFSAALECTSISTPLVVGDKELQKTRMRGVGGVNASVAKIRHCSLIIIPILDNTYI